MPPAKCVSRRSNDGRRGDHRCGNAVSAGFAVVKGAEWARWVGIIVAGGTAVMSFQWIYFQPLWTILSVTLCLLVIVPLAAYGGRRGVLGSDQR